jgi:hypothetical protein
LPATGGSAKVEAALRNHRHGLHAHTEEGVAHAGLDLRCGNMHGLHRRAAKAVHGHAAHGFGQAGQQTDDARQIVALCGLGVGTAEDHILQ